MSISIKHPAQHQPVPQVAFVIAHMGFGGAQRALTNMVNRWSARGSLQPSLFVLEGETKPAYALAPEIRIHWLGLTGNSLSPLAKISSNVARIRALRKALTSARPDVVVAFMDVTNVLTVLACVGTGLKVAVSERVHPSLYNLGPLWSLLRWFTYPQANALVVQSQSIANWFPDRLHRHIRIIPNPVPRPFGPAAFPVARAQRIVLAVGRLHPQKGFDLLLRAFATLAATYPEWDLHILGEGLERGRLETLAKDLDIAGRVHLPGVVSPINEYYRAAGVFVLPSRFEGFPNALAEAMAHGLPVLAADCPGAVRDLVQDGANGLLARPQDALDLADKLGLLLGSADLRQRLGQKALDVCGRFDEDRILDLWEQLFQDLQKGD